MKTYLFIVIFTNGSEKKVYSFGSVPAMLIACGEEANKGNHYVPDSISCPETKEFWSVNAGNLFNSVTKR